MKILRIADLALVAVVFAAIGWGIAEAAYGSLPAVPTLVGLPLLVLAVVEAIAGWNIRRRIGRREVGAGLHDLHPLAVARAAVLAKATAVVGAAITGGWVGITIFVGPRADRLTAAADDLPGAVFGIVASALLTAAGVWLERCCTVPPESGQADRARGGSDAGPHGRDG